MIYVYVIVNFRCIMEDLICFVKFLMVNFIVFIKEFLVYIKGI